MSHFSDLSDITLNMYYINSSHHLNTLVIISVPVDTASPSLLYLQSSCAKTSLTASYSIMPDRTVLCLHWCSFCMSILYATFSLSTLRKEFYYDNTWCRHKLDLFNSKSNQFVCPHLHLSCKFDEIPASGL